MVIISPPIQENTTAPSGKFPQAWLRWLGIVRDKINELLEDVETLTPIVMTSASTGWTSGGVLSLNTDTSKFDYTTGSGYRVNANDPTNITTTLVSFDGATGITPEFLATNAVSFVAIDENGNLEQGATFPVGDDLRDHIQLGALVHGDNTTIDGVSNFTSAVPFQIAPSLTDLQIALGVVQTSGNDFTGSGNANLRFEKSAGTDFYFGIQSKVDPTNPNNITNILQNEPDVDFSWRDGLGGFNTKRSKDITSGVYDNGTGGASDPSGNVNTNKWINARIKYSPDADAIFIEYGSVVYNNSTDARAGINLDFFGDNPSFAGVPIRAYLSIRGAASDLDDVGDGVFTQTNRFGLI